MSKFRKQPYYFQFRDEECAGELCTSDVPSYKPAFFDDFLVNHYPGLE